MGSLSIPISTIVTVANAALAADWSGLIAKLESGDIQQELVVGEAAADFLSQFFPEAQYAEDALKLFGFIVALKQAGVWAPAQPEDPAMQRAAGHSHYTPGKPVVLAPGVDPNDPLGFDSR